MSFIKQHYTRIKHFAPKLYSILHWLFLVVFFISVIGTGKTYAVASVSTIVYNQDDIISPEDSTQTVRFDETYQFTIAGSNNDRYIKVSIPSGVTVNAIDTTALTQTITNTLITLDYGNSGLTNGTYTMHVLYTMNAPTNQTFQQWAVQIYNNSNVSDGTAYSWKTEINYKPYNSDVTVSNIPTVNANISEPVALSGSIKLDKQQIEKGVALALTSFVGYWFIKKVTWRRR